MGADAARRRAAHYRGVRAAAWRAWLRADGLPCYRGAQVHACVVARVAGASRCGIIAARYRCRRFCRGGRACDDDAAAVAERGAGSGRGRAAALIRPGSLDCSHHAGAGVALALALGLAAKNGARRCEKSQVMVRSYLKSIIDRAVVWTHNTRKLLSRVGIRGAVPCLTPPPKAET